MAGNITKHEKRDVEDIPRFLLHRFANIHNRTCRTHLSSCLLAYIYAGRGIRDGGLDDVFPLLIVESLSYK